jgi:8-oxo-dGTP pyrophosphatase MutT (NUDIX family)
LPKVPNGVKPGIDRSKFMSGHGPTRNLTTRILQRYWRLTRGLTLGAQGCVIDSSQRILLVRHTYRPGWHFPGGGVEKGESVFEALTRELQEEAGVHLSGEPELYGLYSNSSYFPGDHIALFLIRDWHQPSVPRPSREIAEQRFVSGDELPSEINRPTRDRILEILQKKPRSQTW